jgi:hypothetical protein
MSTGGVNPQLTETFREAVKDLLEDQHERETANKVSEANKKLRGKKWYQKAN